MTTKENQPVSSVNAPYEHQIKNEITPIISIYTTAYNRRSTLPRTIASVEAQTFRDIEYIIVDDGSDAAQSVDDIVGDFMSRTDIPVKFLKQPNMGMHIARNCAQKNARGKFTISIDSDDELMPDACKNFLDAWEEIPKEKKYLYRESVGLCVDQNGKIVGDPYPENANSMTLDEFKKSHKHGERHALWLTEIMQANLYPEPEGVKYVTSGILWSRLRKKYLSWRFNKVTRIYHMEGTDHVAYQHKNKTLQRCKDFLWAQTYKTKSREIYYGSFTEYIKDILHYGILKNIIEKRDPDFVKKYPLEGFANKFWYAVIYLPAKILTPLYVRKRCNFS